MADDESKPHGYFGLRKVKEGLITGFCYMPNAQDVRDWLAGQRQQETEVDEESASNLSTEAQALETAMSRILHVTHGQMELVRVTRFLGYSYLNVVIESEIVNPMKNEGTLIDDREEGQIYKLNHSPFEWFNPLREKIDRIETGFSALPEAVFMGIVATFDFNISEIVRVMLGIRSERLQSNGKTIPLLDVLRAKSIEELIQKAIDDEIYMFLRGSHEEQVKYIEDNFNIEIIKHWKRWPDFIEVFERRNLLAHGERLFTQRYVNICVKAGHKGSENLLGKPVELKSKYIIQALDVMLEFYLLLVFMFWKKHLPNEKSDAFSSINDKVYKLILEKRYVAAKRVGEFALSIKDSSATDYAKKMLTINLASAHIHANEDKSGLQILEEIDWTASADNFRICVFSLKKEVDRVIELMPSVVASGSIRAIDFRVWPVFDFIRENENFCKKYREIFGEDLNRGVATDALVGTASEQSDAQAEEQDGNDTVH